MNAFVLILFLAIPSLIYCESVIFDKQHELKECSEPLMGINVITPGDSDLVELQLQKTVFKKYEPIEVLIKYINNGNKDDSIYFMFNDFTNFIDFEIKDDKGININEKDKQGFTLGMALRPNYIVKPSDTLITTITLNGFGKKTEDMKTYFQYQNYFPVGKYKFHAIIYGDLHKSFNIPIITDDIEFEIVDVDETDIKVIDMSREGKFYDIQKNYSTNYFYEYALRENVKSNIGKYYKKEIAISVLENSYTEYVKMYPQSYYTIPFLKQYLSLVSNDDATNLDYIAQRLLSEHNNSMIEVFLTNRMMLESTKLIIIESRKVEKRKDQ